MRSDSWLAAAPFGMAVLSLSCDLRAAETSMPADGSPAPAPASPPAAEPSEGADAPPTTTEGDEFADFDVGEPPEPEEKRVAFSLGFFLYEAIGAGVGANLGVHVGPTTLVEVDGYVAGAVVPTQSSRSVALRIQQFAGTHTYFRGGARFRRLVIKDLLDFDLGELRKRTLQKDLGVDFALGNRWTFGSVILAVDWAGVYVPLTAFETDRRIVDPENGEILAQSKPGLSIRPDVRIGYLQVGAAF